MDLFSGPDLYSNLLLSWSAGSAFSGSLNFMADTDQVTDVPEPASAILMGLGLGLVGLAFGSTKRKNA
ncbi:hypothetical protein QQ73_19180 [Candidatus Endoriftia persephone str. Guaymas]|nr:hypothetical protein [Candidatus Endoriftia persephone str. Guaymas]